MSEHRAPTHSHQRRPVPRNYEEIPAGHRRLSVYQETRERYVYVGHVGDDGDSVRLLSTDGHCDLRKAELMPREWAIRTALAERAKAAGLDEIAVLERLEQLAVAGALDDLIRAEMQTAA